MLYKEMMKLRSQAYNLRWELGELWEREKRLRKIGQTIYAEMIGRIRYMILKDIKEIQRLLKEK